MEILELLPRVPLWLVNVAQASALIGGGLLLPRLVRLVWWEYLSQGAFVLFATLYWLRLWTSPWAEVAVAMAIVPAFLVFMRAMHSALQRNSAERAAGMQNAVGLALDKSAAPIAIFIVDSHETIVWCAGSATTLPGREPRALVGRTLDQTIGHRPDLLERWRAAMDGAPQSLLHRSGDGEPLFTQWEPIRLPDDPVHPMVVAMAYTVAPASLIKPVRQRIAFPEHSDDDIEEMMRAWRRRSAP